MAGINALRREGSAAPGWPVPLGLRCARDVPGMFTHEASGQLVIDALSPEGLRRLGQDADRIVARIQAMTP